MVITRPDKIACNLNDVVERMNQLKTVGIQIYTVQNEQSTLAPSHFTTMVTIGHAEVKIRLEAE